MSWVAVAVVGTGLIAAKMQSDAARSASRTQAGAAEAGIAEQQRQFDAMQELLKPYTEAGVPALQQMQAMLGLSGPQAEQAAIAGVEGSPTFQASLQQGENAMLQNASATGGLRGGNIQAALAQFRPQLLAQEIENRFARLGGITSLGQQSAAGVGTAGMNTGTNIATLLGQQGAARAGGILGQSQIAGNALNLIPQGLGAYYGATGRMPWSAAPQLSTAQQFGTVPGSQQTNMLAAQQF